jgi:hypothetical protein
LPEPGSKPIYVHAIRGLEAIAAVAAGISRIGILVFVGDDQRAGGIQASCMRLAPRPSCRGGHLMVAMLSRSNDSVLVGH